MGWEQAPPPQLRSQSAHAPRQDFYLRAGGCQPPPPLLLLSRPASIEEGSGCLLLSPPLNRSGVGGLSSKPTPRPCFGIAACARQCLHFSCSLGHCSRCVFSTVEHPPMGCQVDTAVLDNTGTSTEGVPRVGSAALGVTASLAGSFARPKGSGRSG